MLDPFRHVAQLDVENGCLNVVEERRVAMIVILTGLAILAVVAQTPDGERQVCIVRCHRAAVSKSSEEFKGIEAKTPSPSEATGSTALIHRANRLRSVLDQKET